MLLPFFRSLLCISEIHPRETTNLTVRKDYSFSAGTRPCPGEIPPRFHARHEAVRANPLNESQSFSRPSDASVGGPELEASRKDNRSPWPGVSSSNRSTLTA